MNKVVNMIGKDTTVLYWFALEEREEALDGAEEGQEVLLARATVWHLRADYPVKAKRGPEKIQRRSMIKPSVSTPRVNVGWRRYSPR